MNRTIHQVRTISPRVIIRVNRRDVAGQSRNGAPPTDLISPFLPPMHSTIIIHVHDRRTSALPRIALPKLHVVVLASCGGRLVRAAPLGHFFGADGDEGGEFVAGSCAATVAAEGELAGDFGGEVSEEMGHGDEAAADNTGCDLGDTVYGVSLRDASSAESFQAYVHNATGNR